MDSYTPSNIGILDTLCTKYYNPRSPQEYTQVQQEIMDYYLMEMNETFPSSSFSSASSSSTLWSILNSTDTLPYHIANLKTTQQTYTQCFLASTINGCINEHWTLLPNDLRYEIAEFLCEWIITYGRYRSVSCSPAPTSASLTTTTTTNMKTFRTDRTPDKEQKALLQAQRAATTVATRTLARILRLSLGDDLRYSDLLLELQEKMSEFILQYSTTMNRSTPTTTTTLPSNQEIITCLVMFTMLIREMGNSSSGNSSSTNNYLSSHNQTVNRTVFKYLVIKNLVQSMVTIVQQQYLQLYHCFRSLISPNNNDSDRTGNGTILVDCLEFLSVCMDLTVTIIDFEQNYFNDALRRGQRYGDDDGDKTAAEDGNDDDDDDNPNAAFSLSSSERMFGQDYHSFIIPSSWSCFKESLNVLSTYYGLLRLIIAFLHQAVGDGTVSIVNLSSSSSLPVLQPLTSVFYTVGCKVLQALSSLSLATSNEWTEDDNEVRSHFLLGQSTYILAFILRSREIRVPSVSSSSTVSRGFHRSPNVSSASSSSSRSLWSILDDYAWVHEICRLIGHAKQNIRLSHVLLYENHLTQYLVLLGTFTWTILGYNTDTLTSSSDRQPIDTKPVAAHSIDHILYTWALMLPLVGSLHYRMRISHLFRSLLTPLREAIFLRFAPVSDRPATIPTNPAFSQQSRNVHRDTDGSDSDNDDENDDETHPASSSSKLHSSIDETMYNSSMLLYIELLKYDLINTLEYLYQAMDTSLAYISSNAPNAPDAHRWNDTVRMHHQCNREEKRLAWFIQFTTLLMMEIIENKSHHHELLHYALGLLPLNEPSDTGNENTFHSLHPTVLHRVGPHVARTVILLSTKELFATTNDNEIIPRNGENVNISAYGYFDTSLLNSRTNVQSSSVSNEGSVDSSSVLVESAATEKLSNRFKKFNLQSLRSNVMNKVSLDYYFGSSNGTEDSTPLLPSLGALGDTDDILSSLSSSSPFLRPRDGGPGRSTSENAEGDTGLEVTKFLLQWTVPPDVLTNEIMFEDTHFRRMCGVLLSMMDTELLTTEYKGTLTKPYNPLFMIKDEVLRCIAVPWIIPSSNESALSGYSSSSTDTSVFTSMSSGNELLQTIVEDDETFGIDEPLVLLLTLLFRIILSFHHIDLPFMDQVPSEEVGSTENTNKGHRFGNRSGTTKTNRGTTGNTLSFPPSSSSSSSSPSSLDPLQEEINNLSIRLFQTVSLASNATSSSGTYHTPSPSSSSTSIVKPGLTFGPFSLGRQDTMGENTSFGSSTRAGTSFRRRTTSVSSSLASPWTSGRRKMEFALLYFIRNFYTVYCIHRDDSDEWLTSMKLLKQCKSVSSSSSLYTGSSGMDRNTASFATPFQRAMDDAEAMNVGLSSSLLSPNTSALLQTLEHHFEQKSKTNLLLQLLSIMNLSSPSDLLDILMLKLLDGVRQYSTVPTPILAFSLQIFHDYSLGTMVLQEYVNIFVQRQAINIGKDILHTETVQSFLRYPDSLLFSNLRFVTNYRYRTLFYSTITRLLFMYRKSITKPTPPLLTDTGIHQPLFTPNSIEGTSNIAATASKASFGGSTGPDTKTFIYTEENSNDWFRTYMEPFRAVLNHVSSVFLNDYANLDTDDIHTYRADPEREAKDQEYTISLRGHVPLSSMKNDFISFLRDMKGIIQAAHTPNEYRLVHEWLTDYRFHLVFCRRVPLLYHCITDADVWIPLLHCLTEYATNTLTRIIFPPGNTSGYVIFREIAFTLNCCYDYLYRYYTQTIVTDQASKKDTLIFIKILRLCFRNAYTLLVNKFANVGIMSAFDDTSSTEVWYNTIRLYLCVPLNWLTKYPKLSYSMCTVIRILVNNPLPIILSSSSSSMSPDTLVNPSNRVSNILPPSVIPRGYLNSLPRIYPVPGATVSLMSTTVPHPATIVLLMSLPSSIFIGLLYRLLCLLNLSSSITMNTNDKYIFRNTYLPIALQGLEAILIVETSARYVTENYPPTTNPNRAPSTLYRAPTGLRLSYTEAINVCNRMNSHTDKEAYTDFLATLEGSRSTNASSSSSFSVTLACIDEELLKLINPNEINVNSSTTPNALPVAPSSTSSSSSLHGIFGVSFIIQLLYLAIQNSRTVPAAGCTPRSSDRPTNGSSSGDASLLHRLSLSQQIHNYFGRILLYNLLNRPLTFEQAINSIVTSTSNTLHTDTVTVTDDFLYRIEQIVNYYSQEGIEEFLEAFLDWCHVFYGKL